MTARNAQSWGAQPDVPDTHFVSGDVYTDPAIFDDEKKKVNNKGIVFTTTTTTITNNDDKQDQQNSI